MNLAHTDAVGNLPPDLAGPVKLELAGPKNSSRASTPCRAGPAMN